MCQTCLDKLLEVMDGYSYEGEDAGARDPCMVDFETLELYSLQEHYIAHCIRDYYVRIYGSNEDELEVMGFYAPELENGEKAGALQRDVEMDIIGISE